MRSSLFWFQKKNDLGMGGYMISNRYMNLESNSTRIQCIYEDGDYTYING